MKKTHFWIAFVIPLLFYSCLSDPVLEHDPGHQKDKLLTVNEARAYFEQQFTRETRSDLNRSTFLPEDFTPEWSDAAQAENGRVTRVDIPILSNTRLRALRSEYINCAAQPYIVDVAVKLVVLRKFGSENPISQYLMLLVPDRSYYANHKSNLDKIIPESADMDAYSGYAIYYKLYSNKPSYISKYLKGILVEHLGLTNEQEGCEERVKQMQIILSQIRFAKSSCVQTRMGGEIDDVIIYGCGNCLCSPCQCGNQPYPTEPSGCSNCGCDPCQCSNDACSACQSNPCQCHNNNICPSCGSDSCGGSCVGGSSGGGGNSGSGNNNDGNNNNNKNPKKYTPQNNDKLVKDNLPKSITPQKPNQCVVTTMEYICKILGNGNMDRTDYLNKYLALTKDHMAVQYGIDLKYIEKFVNDNFITDTFTNYEKSINNGQIVMTAISGINVDLHSIAIVGYRSGGMIIYMDPELGRLQEASSNILTGTYFFSIKQVK